MDFNWPVIVNVGFALIISVVGGLLAIVKSSVWERFISTDKTTDKLQKEFDNLRDQIGVFRREVVTREEHTAFEKRVDNIIEIHQRLIESTMTVREFKAWKDERDLRLQSLENRSK